MWLKVAKTPDMTQPITLAVVWYFVYNLTYSTNQSCHCIQLTLIYNGVQIMSI